MEYGEEFMVDLLRGLDWCLILLFRPDITEERIPGIYEISVLANECDTSEYEVLVFLLKELEPDISEKEIENTFVAYFLNSDISQDVRHKVRDFSLETLVEKIWINSKTPNFA